MLHSGHSSVDAHSGCFHVLAIVNGAVMNIRVQVSFQMSGFVYFRYLSRSGIAGSHGSSISNFLRKLCTISHSGCNNLHFHLQCVRIPFSSHAFMSSDIHNCRLLGLCVKL